MALTAKPIATISYNTREFLEKKCQELFNSGRIEDYRFISHQGELDPETGEFDKDHHHLWISPNRRIDTVDLRREFDEVDFQHPEHTKPLGCLPFRASKSDDWLMYAVHDPLYLQNHHSDNDGDGKIQYNQWDIVTPFEDQLARDFKRALQLRQTKTQRVINALEHGMSGIDVLQVENYNPTQLAAILKIAEKSSILSELVPAPIVPDAGDPQTPVDLIPEEKVNSSDEKVKEVSDDELNDKVLSRRGRSRKKS